MYYLAENLEQRRTEVATKLTELTGLRVCNNSDTLVKNLMSETEEKLLSCKFVYVVVVVVFLLRFSVSDS